MNAAKKKTVVLDLHFGSRDLYDRFIRDVRRDPGLESHIVRGRLAADTAWVKLELHGSARRIDELVELWSESSQAFANVPQAVA